MKDRNYLINMYNATSTEHPKGSDEIETYEHWLERQLIHRIDVIEKHETKGENLPISDVRASLSGAELISLERCDQIDKHGRTIELDKKLNTRNQLSYAASALVSFIDGETIEISSPPEWNEEIWQYMMGKSYKERLIIAGALIAAEIDRVG